MPEQKCHPQEEAGYDQEGTEAGLESCAVPPVPSVVRSWVQTSSLNKLEWVEHRPEGGGQKVFFLLAKEGVTAQEGVQCLAHHTQGTLAWVPLTSNFGDGPCGTTDPSIPPGMTSASAPCEGHRCICKVA